MLPSMDIGMQIIHLKFFVPVSTGTSKVDKLLKMPPADSISEGIIFQDFLWGHAPDPLVLACFSMSVCFTYYECEYPHQQ